MVGCKVFFLRFIGSRLFTDGCTESIRRISKFGYGVRMWVAG